MFEVGFTEILVISVLALVVLGPEKLPRVAAQIGKWVGRARAMARQFREQLEDEVQLAEAKTKAKETPSTSQAETAGTTPPPGTDTPASSSTDTAAPDSNQNMYSGVTGEHDAHAAPAETATSAPNAASETAHSDSSGPAPEPEAATYQPPAYAQAGANGTTHAEPEGPEANASPPSPVKSPHSHDDDDPPHKPGDFITHTHERGI